MRVLLSFCGFDCVRRNLLRREESRFGSIERLSSYLRLGNIIRLAILGDKSSLTAIATSFSLSIRLLL